ncbi:hypothetical protein QQZ08_006003 [Neonectria magnoliae]|uniref:Uncharacterized protein n=1 Tax=Neonectria magnoliae TaxID=2732573 RepID=A0ABR1I1Y4_9HYPO
MFTTLPDFTPRDSHSLWYRSSRSPLTPAGPLDPHQHQDPHAQHHASNQSRQRGHALERSVLARLAADEQYMQRRRLNVQNYGSGWLKPPGVPKTLHQMREEKREQEEHQEAMRREQLAQELAEAEAEANPEEGMMDDVQLDGAQDLDDEIPDADDEFGLHDDDDEDEDEEELEEEDDEAEAGEEADESVIREERQNDLMASRMRMNDDAFREALVRGDPDGDGMYGGEEEIEEEEQGQILGEDDFVQEGTDDGLGMDMDADLDEDIPEAEDGGYEHTDSEAEFTSSEEEDDDDDDDDDADISFAPRSAAMAPPQSPTLQGRASMSLGRPSMDLSNLLSQDGSSFLESSPAGRRGRQ